MMRGWRTAVATIVIATAAGMIAPARARADGDEPDSVEYRRVAVTTNVLYLFLPIYQLDVEVALVPKWSVTVHGGAGVTRFGNDSTAAELGVRGIYYVLGHASRGVQLGVDARGVRFENDGQLQGLGDGFAAGPFVGYKRVFGSGVTLGASIGAQAVIAGDSEGPVVAYGAATIGVAFWREGGRRASRVPGAQEPDLLDPLDHHSGAMFTGALGLGAAHLTGCDGCELEAGLAVNASIGWFLHRRFALAIDSTALVAVFARSAGFGGFGFGLVGLAGRFWPRGDLWVKVGVGAVQLASSAIGGPGFGVETGGGGTLAVGYEFHRDRNFGLDLQVSATHGSFEPASGTGTTLDGVDTFAALVGVHWY